MSFLEAPRFPDDISYRSRGGPRYLVDITKMTSGWDQRIGLWSYPLHDYDVMEAVKAEIDLYEILEFFHALGGPEIGFRWKDWADYQSNSDMYAAISDTDQQIGVGDGVETQFQLIKTYSKGALDRVRLIQKPVDTTTIIALDGTPQPSGWTVDTTTGIVTFSGAPANTVVITAGYQMDTPVVFAGERLETAWLAYKLQEATIPLEEIRIKI